MPGYKISRGSSKNPALFDKYQCPYCNHLLKDAVQRGCGHWLCERCAVQLLAESLPKCPKVDCQEFLKSDKKGAECFPDRFVRWEIEKMIVSCPNQLKGCQWEDMLAKLETHLKACNFFSIECNLCSVVLTPDQIKCHGRVCLKALMKCPLAAYGFCDTRTMTREELTQHVKDRGLEHLQRIADALEANVSISRCGEDLMYFNEVIESTMHAVSQQASPHTQVHYAIGRPSDYNDLAEIKAWKTELLEKDKTIRSLISSIAKLENIVASLSKVENYTHSSTWKIPLLSRKMTDARLGFSFFSLPFYSYSHYKMCLQLYVLGDGSGRGTHMSLFFVIMKGEFDNFLKWPFTSKVTFKLINQRGGRDISGTFQPDPKSSSFQKPTSDMNIASGCSRFMCHTELNEGGFIVDDAVFLQCLVDRSSI